MELQGPCRFLIVQEPALFTISNPFHIEAHHVCALDGRGQLLVRLLRRLLPQLGLATRTCVICWETRSCHKPSLSAELGCQRPPEAGPNSKHPPQPTQAAGQGGPDLQLVERLMALQGLGVRVDSPELHALRVMAGMRSTASSGLSARPAGHEGSQQPSSISRPKTRQVSSLPISACHWDIHRIPRTCRPLEIMRFTALPPPPPTPMTLILASPPTGP